MLPEIYDPRQVSLPMEPATSFTLSPRRTAYPVLSEKLWNFSRLPGFIQMVTDFGFVNNLYTLCYKMLELLWLLVIPFDVVTECLVLGLGAFAELCKVTNGFVMSVCLCVLMGKISGSTGRIFVKFDI